MLISDVSYNTAKLPLTNDTREYSQINDIYGLCQVNNSEYTRVTLECSSINWSNVIVNNLPRQVSSFGVLNNGLSDHSTGLESSGQ